MSDPVNIKTHDDQSNGAQNPTAPAESVKPTQEPKPAEDESPKDSYKPVEYKVNHEHMNTMPEANNEYYMNGPNDYRGSNTQNNFHPRRTFQAQSTDRGYGMKRFARLSGNWDERFHVSPSRGNAKSHTYYKQFFDKPTRSTQGVVLKPKKRIDPYLENERKSRIPAYSQLYKECKFATLLVLTPHFRQERS